MICEENECDNFVLEFIYESFESDWDVTVPEPDDEDEEDLYHFLITGIIKSSMKLMEKSKTRH